MSKKSSKPLRVLVVDDEPHLRELVELTLLKMGLDVELAEGVVAAIERIDQGGIDLCLTDMRMPDGSGLDVVRHIDRQGYDIPVAVITAYGSLDNAVEALKAGAFDYLAKPVSLDQLRTLVRSALELDKPASRTVPGTDKAFIGDSLAIREALTLIDKLARSQAPVYITGESGSGKERAARLIHGQSIRADKPFVPVNCGAIPENLMESEFFGYKKGAFTGADGERDGFFQAADGGTLFLDEVADLPLAMQVKLLRVIQEKKVRKIGDTREISVDVRIICATHQDLANCVEEGRFRQDLYYRLNVIELRMPSLRDMREDIPNIAHGVLARLSAQNGMDEPRLAPEALAALIAYDFAGNVRELENILERALALCDGRTINTDDLQLKRVDAEDLPVDRGEIGLLQDYLDRVEKDAILSALDRTRFNRTQAAKLLGVTFRSLRYRMERLGIN
ncbi:sigma-54-dependent transcriptional regulator [Chitinimonas sp. BJB300]|uniref:sigma-54-dependent transcriptional regulator n=1 Tax=Chitinimonas sp. BJB300 TaxID=1559339 RepID=UPI000C0F7415|nr:sigma-54 dependent transcriptional regulator [Chitinimonas sp. BJB300]PHV11303.1 sigma-54-dependent Fis family transcriptional regulator [Chitinimonas sp. BJB300]TSJ91573.1 sigma-54-dependent Fis family transcriptional regulator [Chitinimonas sp. BJB300]